MTDWLVETEVLARQGEPFAVATVVRCERPTSAKPGAKALIRRDGTVSGWIGGSCAEPVAVKEALGSLEDGEPRFLVLVGKGGALPGRAEGVREYTMTCHSGGTLEIFVEPMLPKPALVLVGSGPGGRDARPSGGRRALRRDRRRARVAAARGPRDRPRGR